MHSPSAIPVRRELVARTFRCGIRDAAGRVRPEGGNTCEKPPEAASHRFLRTGSPAPRPARGDEFRPTTRRPHPLRTRAVVTARPPECGNSADREGSVAATAGSGRKAESHAGETGTAPSFTTPWDSPVEDVPNVPAAGVSARGVGAAPPAVEASAGSVRLPARWAWDTAAHADRRRRVQGDPAVGRNGRRAGRPCRARRSGPCTGRRGGPRSEGAGRWTDPSSRTRPADESGCTPGSVPAGPRGPAGDGHPSRAGVAAGLVRSTRGLGRAALERPRKDAFSSEEASPLDLAPGGVYLAA